MKRGLNGQWVAALGTLACYTDGCDSTIQIGEAYWKFDQCGAKWKGQGAGQGNLPCFGWCKKCALDLHEEIDFIPIPQALLKQEQNQSAKGQWEVATQGFSERCEANHCRHIPNVGESYWRFGTEGIQGAIWCKKCGTQFAKNFNIPPLEDNKDKHMEAFETLNIADQATATSKRFALQRDVVAQATSDSMKRAWKEGNHFLLTNSAGKSLYSKEGTPPPSKPQFSNDLATVIAEAVKGKVGTDEPRVEVIARRIAKEEDAWQEKKLTEAMKKLIEESSSRTVTISVPELKLKKEMGRQHQKFEEVFKLTGLKLNIWMAGPAGAGKSYLASEVARALDRPFFRISCGPQTAASQIFGHTTAQGGYAPGIAYQAITHEKGAVLLFDEFDRLNPAVAVMVNGLLDGGVVTFPNGETLGSNEKTVFLVAANTFGKPTAEFGTAQKQDIATMSRFVKVYVPVDEKLETAVFGSCEWVKYVQKVRKVVTQLGVTSIVVTPRASEYGVKMIASGMSKSAVEDLLLWNGVPQEDVKKIKANL